MRNLIIVVLGLAFLAACSKQQQTQSTSAESTVPTQAVTTASSPVLKMAFSTTPDPPVSGKPTTFRVKLTSDSGHPVNNADVKVALVMPTMDMGKNEITLSDKGGGDYEGTGQYTMAGPWNAVVSASVQGKSSRQAFQQVVHKE